MRKADSSFLQNQLAEKQSFVEDLTKLLDDLETARLEDPLERERLQAEENRLAHGVRLQQGVMALIGRLPGAAWTMERSYRLFLRWRPALQRWASRLDRPGLDRPNSQHDAPV